MITVLLFAHLQEDAGSDRIQLEVNETTVGDLKKLLQETYKLTQMDQVMVALNEEYALNEDQVKSGDVVALIPPVSGG